jgi:hypothetical protein
MTEEELGERLTAAFDLIATSLQRIAVTMERNLEKRYPPRRVPADMDITTVPTEEERIREEQQGEDSKEPIDKWTRLDHVGERQD